jgi:hypothetical protein
VLDMTLGCISMSLRTDTLLIAAVVSGVAFAQPERVSIDRASIEAEERLREQIATVQTQAGVARPAELVDPLRALAVVHEEANDHALALATLEEARHVTRIHHGLTSADEALLIRQQIRSEKALGNHGRVWELEQDMVTTARHHLDDIRMLPIFRELADDRLGVIDQVRAGERPPAIYVGCYNNVPLPPYDYTPSGRPSGPTANPSCFGGLNDWLIAKLRGEILLYYADAIEVILRAGDYASEELRQLERAAIRVASEVTVGSVRTSSEASGSIASCSSGTLEHFLALEILDSCLAPVSRGNNFVVANVGGRVSLLRLLSYEVRSGAPPVARASALAELADGLVLAVPGDRRRFLMNAELVLALYERAYGELQQSGDLQTSTQLFAPQWPVTLPIYEPNPFASAAASSRYIDVAFDITKYGTAERIEILTTSQDATRNEKRDLLRLIESTNFRPRSVDGKFGDSAPVSVRYGLSP